MNSMKNCLFCFPPYKYTFIILALKNIIMFEKVAGKTMLPLYNVFIILHVLKLIMYIPHVSFVPKYLTAKSF